MRGFLNLTDGSLLRLRLALKALIAPVVFGVSILIETKDGRIVLIRHRFGPGLHLPGGGVNQGEAASDAAWREACEEAGLVSGERPVLFGVYTRKVGIVKNVVALYHIAKADIAFKPNLEISEMLTIDPRDPPAEASPGTKKRLAEFLRQAPQSEIW